MGKGTGSGTAPSGPLNLISFALANLGGKQNYPYVEVGRHSSS